MQQNLDKQIGHKLRRKYCTNTFERKPNKNCDWNKAFTSFTQIATQILHEHVRKETEPEQELFLEQGVNRRHIHSGKQMLQ